MSKLRYGCDVDPEAVRLLALRQVFEELVVEVIRMPPFPSLPVCAEGFGWLVWFLYVSCWLAVATVVWPANVCIWLYKRVRS